VSRLSGWAARLLATGSQSGRHKLHVLRFGRLTENLAALVELCDDATQKLGGQWVLDRRYVASFARGALDLARQIVFDSGVMAGDVSSEHYTVLDSVRRSVDELLAAPAPAEHRAEPLLAELGLDEAARVGGPEPPGSLSGVLLTSDPDRPLSMRLEISPGDETHVVPRHPTDDAPDRASDTFAPLARMGLVVERLAGRPQRIAWRRAGAGFAVVEREDLASPVADPPSGPRLAAALHSRETVFRDAGSVAVAGLAVGRVRRGSGKDVSDAARPCVLVLDSAGTLSREAWRDAAAVLVVRGPVEEPWLATAREWCVPVLLGLGAAGRGLKEGETVTVDAQEGVVYRGLVEELVLYHLAEPASLQREPEYGLLREAIRRVAPPPGAGVRYDAGPDPVVSPLVGVLRAAHERALASFGALHFGPRGRRAGTDLRGALFPGSLRVVDAGGGTSPAGDHGWRPGVTWDRIRSQALRALLEPLSPAEPGPAPSPGRPAPAALAVLTEERATLHVEWPGGAVLVEASLGENPTANTVYCALRGTPVGDEEPMRRSVIESGFRLLDLGPGLTGWMRARDLEETRRILWRVGRSLGTLLAEPARARRVHPDPEAGRDEREDVETSRGNGPGGQRA
jgi:phosphohistidine swiveling domain-containing protein